MDRRADARYELNEVGWWSNWAEMTWVSPKVYVMGSDEFGEPFFNRAGFIEMDQGWAEAVRKMESIFEGRRLPPYIYVQDTPDFAVVRGGLAKDDYAVVDKMSVMEVRRPSFHSNPDVLVERTNEEGAREWCEAYLLSFYGDLELIEPTLEVVQRSMKQAGVGFVSARMGESIAGTLVMYQKQDLLGAYCVGTLPRFRKRGVATTMLEFAEGVSRDTGATMILQTMLSDGVEDLYIRLGLVPVYRKEVFARKRELRS